MSVARDAAAGSELLAAAAELDALRQLDPDGVVRILAVDAGPPAGVVCEWLDGRELHLVAGEDGSGRFVAVERFVQRPDGGQAMVVERLADERSDAVWARWLHSLVAQTTLDRTGEYACLPRVEVDDGDLVVLGDDRPVLVDLTPGPRELALGAWTLELLSPAGGERPDAPAWGKPRLAVRHLAEAIAARAADGLDARRCRETALAALRLATPRRAGLDAELRAALEML